MSKRRRRSVVDLAKVPVERVPVAELSPSRNRRRSAPQPPGLSPSRYYDSDSNGGRPPGAGHAPRRRRASVAGTGGSVVARRSSLHSQHDDAPAVPLDGVPDSQLYFAFTPDLVREVVRRINLLNSTATIEHQWLTKAEFREVMTNYSVMPPAELPLRIFFYYVDHKPNVLLPSAMEDDAEPGMGVQDKVRAGEVVLMLILMCNGSRQDRIDLFMDIFLQHHASDDGDLAQDCFKTLLYLLCSAAYKGGMELTRMPPKKLCDREASPYGAAPTVSELLVRQWIDYSLLNGRLLRRISAAHKAAEGNMGERAPKKQPSTDDERKKLTKKVSVRRGLRGRSRSFSRIPKVDTVATPASRQRAGLAAHGIKRPEEVTTSAGVVSLHRVKKSNSNLSTLLSMVARRTNFRGRDVRQLYDKFREYSNEEGRLNMHGMYKLIVDVYPLAARTANVCITSLFDGFDTNLSGDLDFKVGCAHRVRMCTLLCNAHPRVCACAGVCVRHGRAASRHTSSEVCLHV